jgi:formate hydrogenlyase transcriptional activator
LGLELQAKLLRVLQTGEFERVGSARTRRVDVRIIAATHQNLEQAIAAGGFRPDLYYRLSVVPITLPPLRARREDIPLLVWACVTRRQGVLRKRITEIPDPIMQTLQAYDWPGNIRELENVVERALIRSGGPILQLDDVLSPGDPATAAGPVGGRRLEVVERGHLLEVLAECQWRINGPGNAAERLGLNPSTLRFRMRKLGIVRPGRRKEGPGSSA